MQDERKHDTNKIITKLVLPAIIIGIALTNTGCVAARCYSACPETQLGMTLVTTPVVETVYVEQPVHRTIHTPPPPHKPTPYPKATKAKPFPTAKPIALAKPTAKARPAPKAKTAPTRQQAKASPQQKPAPKPKKRG